MSGVKLEEYGAWFAKCLKQQFRDMDTDAHGRLQ